MYLRQSPATLFARDAILEFCPTSPYLAGAVVVFVPLFVWKPSSIHKRIIMEDAWCTTIMCSSTLCGWSEMCVSFGLRCLSGFKSLSHALLPMSVNGKGRRSFCFKEKGKEAFDVV